MSRIAGSSTEVAIRDLRNRFVPLISTIAAICLVLLPFVAAAPLIPDLGFLTLITWRLLRPEIWSANMALGLGLLNDLVAGNPLGQSMLLWTSAFLVFDLIDSRLGFRDYWMDWLIAAGAIAFQTVGAWYIALLMGSDVLATVVVPQLIVGILAYPVVARLVLALDRWRLAR
ncbi:rod shape-determining protein MreD [Sphingosinicella sp. LHD-64]|uniref:rod shape-determining protein MreD n=1 Tax=Sphingosinicella sp. LHD-64 TaxID=3072139 RepID=UPI00280ED34B|nr:rod shape-determining protein MreD [Sphingosinicella sp. LHD-64]MDQ8755282.1 rod shape-determining protein MreD [Sphingosinicella sp. LHD-64]